MKSSLQFKIISLCISFTCCFIFGEIVFRFLVSYDEDGNSWIGKRILLPYHLPLEAVQKNVDTVSSSQNSIVVYDSLTGWIPRPGKHDNDFNIHNALGIRESSKSREFTKEPGRGIVRIALFGDSYIYGNEVPFEESIGYYLEQNLKKSGIQAEVLNFGVGAFGMDQAFLRWYYQGQQLSPDIVVMGFQPENAFRNVNMIRAFYSRKEALPLSKPRFIIEADTLRLINHPGLPPAALVPTIRNIKNWPLATHESFYNPDDYEEKLWLKSKLVAYVMNIIAVNRWTIKKTEIKDFNIRKEPAILTLKIMDAFKMNVEKYGAKFYTVHIPRSQDLADKKNNENFVYKDMLQTLEKKMTLIHTEDALMQAAKNTDLSDLFEANGHYSAKGNAAVAKEISRFIHGERQKNNLFY